MRSRSKNSGYIFLIKYKFILGAILLSLVLYAVAGSGEFKSAKAGTGNRQEMPGYTKNSLQMSDEQAASWDVILMRVTAYCWCWKCCGKHSDGITANGHRIKLGDTFVAADKRYSFGTEMIIPGYNNSEPVKVLDRGGAIRGNRLDVFFNSHQKALDWGVQYLPVKVRSK